MSRTEKNMTRGTARMARRTQHTFTNAQDHLARELNSDKVDVDGHGEFVRDFQPVRLPTGAIFEPNRFGRPTDLFLTFGWLQSGPPTAQFFAICDSSSKPKEYEFDDAIRNQPMPVISIMYGRKPQDIAEDLGASDDEDGDEDDGMDEEEAYRGSLDLHVILTKFLDLWKDPSVMLVPFQELPLPRHVHERSAAQLERLMKMFIQHSRYQRMSEEAIRKEALERGIVFDLLTPENAPHCCICTSTSDVRTEEMSLVERFKKGDSKLTIIAARDVPSDSIRAICIFEESEWLVGTIVVHVLCSRQSVPSPAARLLFACLLQNLRRTGFHQVRLVALRDAQPFYATFGFKGRRRMSLELQPS